MARGYIRFSDSLGNLVGRIDMAVAEVDDFGPVYRECARRWPSNRAEMFASDGWGEWPQPTAAEREVYTRIKMALTGKIRVLRFDRNPGALRLMRSLTGTTSDTVIVITQKSLELGTRVPYASKQRRGGVAPDRLGGHRYPGRDMLMVGTFSRVVNEELAAHAGRVSERIMRDTGARSSGVRHQIHRGDILAHAAGGRR